ncbi:hypothetical protein [Pseudomonas pohangensis]|nr:hypothetical protein [Pseudomonas pohangensis]
MTKIAMWFVAPRFVATYEGQLLADSVEKVGFSTRLNSGMTTN